MSVTIPESPVTLNRNTHLPPYSPDLNPIEQSFAKLKGLLRKTQARTLEALWSAVGSLLELFSASECERYIRHCGYCQSG